MGNTITAEEIKLQLQRLQSARNVKGHIDRAFVEALSARFAAVAKSVVLRVFDRLVVSWEGWSFPTLQYFEVEARKLAPPPSGSKVATCVQRVTAEDRAELVESIRAFNRSKGW